MLIKRTGLFMIYAGPGRRADQLVVSSCVRAFGDWRVLPAITLPNPAYYWRRLKFAAGEWRLRLTPWPVYFWYSATDCDLMHVEYAERFTNGWTACRIIEGRYDSAEGPMSFVRISRKQWLECRHESIRDDIAAREMGY